MKKPIRLHPHTQSRPVERGITEDEVIKTVEKGEEFSAKMGWHGFRHNFVYGKQWRGRTYANKQVEAYAVDEDGWLVITVVAKYF